MKESKQAVKDTSVLSKNGSEKNEGQLNNDFEHFDYAASISGFLLSAFNGFLKGLLLVFLLRELF